MNDGVDVNAVMAGSKRDSLQTFVSQQYKTRLTSTVTLLESEDYSHITCFLRGHFS